MCYLVEWANWDRLSRDLIVAGHFSHLIGVYDLEGCAPGFYVALEDDRTVVAYRAMRVSSRDSPQSWSSGRIVTRAVQISE